MIRLSKLHLDGWLSYDKQDFPLDDPGLTYIQGRTGSGKSAILEAIHYLWFGDTLRKKSRVGDLVNKVLDNGYDICLEYYVDNVLYKVQEVRNRGEQDGFYLWKISGKKESLVEENPNATRIKLQEILGISNEEFKTRVCLGQRITQTLLTGTSGKRAKLIIELFGLDKYAEILVNITQDIKDASSYKEDLIKKLEEYRVDIKGVEESFKSIENPSKVFDPDRLSDLVDKIDKTKSKLAKIKEKERDARDIVSKYKALEEQKDRLRKLDKEIEKLEDEIHSREQKLPDADEETVRDKIDASKSRKTETITKIKQIRKELNDIKTLKNTCPINKEACPINVPKDFAEERKESCNKKLSELENTVTETEEDIGVWNTKLDTIESWKDIKSMLETKQKEKKRYTLNTSIENIDAEKELLEKCKVGLEKGNTRLEELSNEKEKLVGIRAQIEKYEEVKATFEKTVTDKSKKISDLEHKIENQDYVLKYLTAALSIFKDAKLYKIDLVLDLLNKNVNDQLYKIAPKYKILFSSQKEDSKGKKLLDTLDITVYNGAAWVPINMISGGQETQIGLGILLGVFKTSYDLAKKRINCLFLDEIFGYLDSDIIDDVFNAFVDLCSELGTNSIKVISHRADLDTRRFDRIWKILLENGVTHVSI